ncbi:golgin subfamily A member 6-like protein 22 [Astyanax mexicanus]|uniref:Golgin subfamily A member 6-like protein 22 n=1 Tax=Astyanax mexicanus TaxID=7994 RepID=A0A8T2LGF2_ASTMX|nr:golgin subfamily A member 6-like protein 22 [Astyanax mexicanus]
MAVCLVPDFPAVRIALEHLAESDKQLREGVIFSEEESHHLREIADAIKALETSRKAVFDELEVETIEMSKLRHQVLSQGDDVVNEVLAGVAAARDVNAAQLNQLQTEMKSVVEEIELMERRRKVLQGENARLLPDREPMKSSHAIIIEQLNQQLSEKSSTQISLNQLKIHIQNTEQKITQVQKTKTHLIQNLLQERRSFSERKEMLQKEIGGIMNSIQEQKKTNAETCRELDEVTEELSDLEESVRENLRSISQLETSISRRSLKYKEQLEDEIRKSEELHRQKEFIDKELQEEKDSFLQKIQTLQERTAAVENQLEEEEKMKSVHVESVAEILASFRAQRKSEDDALADQHSVSTQLEKSKQRLEEHMASIARNKLNVKEMEEEIKQLQEVRKVNKELFQKNMEELQCQLSKEKKIRAAFEVERDELCQSLKTLKDQHEHGVRERRSEIALMKTKHSDLQDEEKRLESVRLLMDQLSNTVTRAEEESRQIEISYLHQIQHLTTEADSIREARLQKEEALKVQESVLQEVEAQFNIELSRYETLKTQSTELKNRKKNLELPIQQMKEQITQLLKPKEELKNALQTLRAQHMQMLNNQSDKISSTEKLIYRNGLILEQVSMENSRLHLRIELMKEDISTAETEREKSSEQKSWMKKEVQFLSNSLAKAWTTDKLVTEESIDRDQKLLVDLNNFILKTQQRRQQAGDIQSRLEEEITRMSSLFGSVKS